MLNGHKCAIWRQEVDVRSRIESNRHANIYEVKNRSYVTGISTVILKNIEMLHFADTQ